MVFLHSLIKQGVRILNAGLPISSFNFQFPRSPTTHPCRICSQKENIISKSFKKIAQSWLVWLSGLSTGLWMLHWYIVLRLGLEQQQKKKKKCHIENFSSQKIYRKTKRSFLKPWHWLFIQHLQSNDVLWMGKKKKKTHQ